MGVNFNTIVINLTGGPGSGKSTTAAGVFYKLKQLGYVCELVTEYAKDKVWEESYKTLDDQIYVFGKQYHRLWKLKDKVQFIITDSNLPLSIHFSLLNSENFNNLVIEAYNQFNNIMFFINRTENYETHGRIETLEQAKDADKDIKNILHKYNIPYTEIEQQNAVDTIIKFIINKYIKKIK